MRLVQVTIPTGKQEAVLSELDEAGVDYVVTEESSDREYTAVVTFPLPTGAVEPVLERLREAGIKRDGYTVVLDAETVVSKRFESLVDEYEEDGDVTRIAREELQTVARELAPATRTYVILTVISVVIATAGVLLDSAAVVVGSMVIAPLIGPAMATSVGSVIDDEDLFRRGVRLQVVGFGASVAAATGFALFVKTVGLVPPGLEVLEIPQVQERVAPDFLSLGIALGAGVAGAHSLRSGVSASLVGVMIAVALVPPVAVIGVGVAWGLPTVVLGATVLVLINALSINLAALATLWYSGYRPEQWFAIERARETTLRQIAALAVAILVLSSFLGGVTLVSYRQSTEEQAVREEVTTVLDRPVYEDLRLIRVEIRFEGLDVRLRERKPFTPAVERIVVTVGRPGGVETPRLAETIATVVDAPNAVVGVRYVDIAMTNATPGVPRPSTGTDAAPGGTAPGDAAAGVDPGRIPGHGIARARRGPAQHRGSPAA